MARRRKSKNRNALSTSDAKYLAFIDELKKSARLDSPTAEISRFYKEVADLLSEAFDEYEAQDLPKYQQRLEYILLASKDEPALSDPLFQDDLKKSKELLDQKVNERWGFYQRIKYMSALTARNIAGLTSIGQEVINLQERAYEMGTRFGGLAGTIKPKVDQEEQRRINDLIKGNVGQYGNAGQYSNAPTLGQTPTLLPQLPTDKNTLPVKDDTLIGTNTVQNKVLNNLLTVSKETNQDIKDIKKFLTAQTIENDDKSDIEALKSLEKAQESATSEMEVANKRDITKDLIGKILNSKGEGAESGGSGGSGGSEGSGTIEQITNTLLDLYLVKEITKKTGPVLKRGISKVAPLLRNIASKAPSLATIGRVAKAPTSPIGLAITGATLGYQGANAVFPAAIEGFKSLSRTIGEKTKGVDYYKDLFQNSLTPEDLEKSEAKALEFLEKTFKTKNELFKKAFQNGSVFGDGSYRINNKSTTMDEAAGDVERSKSMYLQYKEYVDEKQKQGGLTGISEFTNSEGKQYSNPLYSKEELLDIKNKAAEEASIRAKMVPPIAGPSPDRSSNKISAKSLSSFRDKAPSVMERLMRDLNISQEDAAAILGNLGHESAGLRPDINEANPVVPGSRGGYGWAQWTGSRRKQFEQFAKENNLDITSDEANYQFLVHELKTTEKGSLEAIKNAEGIENKTIAFEQSFERAGIKHYGKRLQYAKKANEFFEQADVDLNARKNQQMVLTRSEVEMKPTGQEMVQNTVSNLSRQNDAVKSQPIIISQNVPVQQAAAEQSTISTKTVGAPSNGASESSFLLALRHILSPLT
jgi:hypothetical protein